MTDRIVAAFDFDGTITTSDSFRAFVLHAAGPARFVLAALRCLPSIAGVPLRLADRGRAKARFLFAALGPARFETLDAAADRFVRERLPALLRDDMLARIREHQALGHEVVLVSASPSLYLRKWAASAGIDTVLASELEWRDGAYTGRLAGRNCWGPEKSARLRAWWGERAPRTLYAYGDSRGDREMAALADHPWIRGTVPMPPMAHAAGGAM
ncbi:HAD family hydrolase [Paraburkholderia caballeronis]|uniref:Phosphatidylglycerophosphatase C n=1 Tax=Paraburkholderia caballeronis TaxID=416943 RepID=A0A1H7VSV7_9BURK|nr:HAD family hydrolase [Paraburkholderia caballeronis]PXW15493.1 phosphatidylglycerophosphatase C [Paraburkholderia caballeronis]PXW93778.1 phosphatidylglycerophosphatase C [Paraburkholderia caballeronis]RAJ89018.1 phosphatidylglycerophosphatase C [Paraburkholderia caballeronis]SED99581.1 phosphatidylglycerophosphatase C [Paraburkholderia caballeronis]SEM11887.1 phosphatidylglycerophosphatase C [Paraburkholderia caballeronis]